MELYKRVVRRLRHWHKERAVGVGIRKSATPVFRSLKWRKRTIEAGRKLIGILLAEHIGDIIACEPVIPWLRERNPEAYLVWLTRPAYVDLVRHHPQIDEVVEIASISDARHIVRCRVFDQAVDLHIAGKHCSVHNRIYSKSWGNPWISTENYFHEGSLLHAMGLSAGLPRLDGNPRIFLPSSARVALNLIGLPSDYVVIHARSNEECKNWQTQRWSELTSAILATSGWTIVEIGLDPVLEANDGRVVNLCKKLSLLETAEVIRNAQGYIGIDSGPAHMANAFCIPSVILLGHYHAFHRYMPYTGFLRNRVKKMVIQWDGPVSEIPVSEVFHRFEALSPVNG